MPSLTFQPHRRFIVFYSFRIMSSPTIVKLPRGLHKKLGPFPNSQAAQACAICLKTDSKYTCPRCGVRYCSSACYSSEKHLRCSEPFFRECCLESLGQVTTDDADKRKVEEILKSELAEASKGDAEEPLDLGERIEGLDLDDEDDLDLLWSRMTERERRDFESQLRNGEATAWLSTKRRKPWWERPLVEELETENEDYASMPQITADVEPLSRLTKRAPSLSIANDVVNVLFAYCYIWRLYDGAFGDDDVELDVVADMMTISSVLRNGSNFSSVAASLCDAIVAVGDSKDGAVLFCSNDFTGAVLKDVSVHCRRGPDFAARALSDAWRAFLIGAKKRLGVDADGPKVNRAARRLAAKKLEFYLSWLADGGGDALTGLASATAKEAEAYRKKIECVKAQAEELEKGD